MSAILNSFVYAVAPSSAPFITSNPSGSLRSDFTGCLGFWFTTPASPVITVTDLGRWKVAGNNQSHTIYLKLFDNTVIASAVVDFSSGGTNGAYNYTAITPVALTPSTTYYLTSSETNGGDQWYDDQAFTNSGVVTAGNSVYQVGCTGDPTHAGAAGNSYVPPNIKLL